MQQILSVFIPIFFVAMIMIALEKLFAAIKDKPIFRLEAFLDLQYLAFVPTIGKLITRAAVLLVMVPLFFLIYGEIPDKAQFEAGFGWLASQQQGLQVLEVLLLADLLGYWMHRLFHGHRLWLFHAIHHSSKELDWLSSVRNHPVNEAVMAMVRALFLLPLGFNLAAVAGVMPFLVLYGLLLHANVNWSFGWLRYVFVSPRYHRWHHSLDEQARNANFAGIFPLWDILFGTLYMPKDETPVKFGIEEKLPASLWGQLKYPFMKL